MAEPAVGFARGLPTPSDEGGLGRARGFLLSAAIPTVGVARGAPLHGPDVPPVQAPPGQTVTQDVSEEMPSLQVEEEVVKVSDVYCLGLMILTVQSFFFKQISDNVILGQVQMPTTGLGSTLVSMFRDIGIDPCKTSWGRGVPPLGKYLKDQKC